MHKIVARGGRCLLPVFALGRAQELLLILEDYWVRHPELHSIPIYYASALASKCMKVCPHPSLLPLFVRFFMCHPHPSPQVYETYINMMNERIRDQFECSANPFHFKHVSNLRGMERFDDTGPCVVMASPGMMQSGLSRELFELWCRDSANGVLGARRRRG